MRRAFMLRVFEAFAGIGTQRMALKRLNIPHEVVGISEIDKYALISYEAIHGDCPNFGDIQQIHPSELPDFDLFTYSFPCQDLSTAGKQRGMVKGQTRSGLLYECEKIIEAKRPRYLLLENVKNLVSQRFKPQFEEWLSFLESLGYTNYWQVLNAKDYNMPQHRERVFVVSILGEHSPFSFPQPMKLEREWTDFLEQEADDSLRVRRSYQSLDPHAQPLSLTQLQSATSEKLKALWQPNKIPEIRKLFNVNPSGKGMNGAVFDSLGLCPTITTNKGEGLKVLVETPLGLLPTITEDFVGYHPISSHPTSVVGTWVYPIPSIKTKSSTTPMKFLSSPNEAVVSLTPASWNRPLLPSIPFSDSCSGLVTLLQARKLSARECWRLMGMSDEDFNRVKAAGISNTQCFYQAGNAIVVEVLEAIFNQLFERETNDYTKKES